MNECFNKTCKFYDHREQDGCSEYVDIRECVHWVREPAATPEPMPTGNGKTVIIEVLSDLLARDTVGQKKYKTSLKTNNGRDALMDAYQEALDLCMYLKQAIMERDHG